MEWKLEEEQRFGLGGGYVVYVEGFWRVVLLFLVCVVRRLFFFFFVQVFWYFVCFSNVFSQCSFLVLEFLREGKLFIKQGFRLLVSQWMVVFQLDVGLCVCQLWIRVMSVVCGYGGLFLGGGCGLGQMVEFLFINRFSMVGRYDLCFYFFDYISYKCLLYKCR